MLASIFWATPATPPNSFVSRSTCQWSGPCVADAQIACSNRQDIVDLTTSNTQKRMKSITFESNTSISPGYIPLYVRTSSLQKVSAERPLRGHSLAFWPKRTKSREVNATIKDNLSEAISVNLYQAKGSQRIKLSALAFDVGEMQILAHPVSISLLPPATCVYGAFLCRMPRTMYDDVLKLYSTRSHRLNT